MIHQEDKKNVLFRRRDLFRQKIDLWLIAWLLGLATVIAVVALLMLSGWFISAAALAGMIALGSHSFNYLVPAAVIRLLAILRTAGRYGELMVSHHAIFGLLQHLRIRFFQQLIRLPTDRLNKKLHSSHMMHRLTYQIDILDQFPLKVIFPWFFAIFILVVFSILFYLKFLYAGLLIIALLMLGLFIPATMTWFGVKYARQQQTLIEKRRVSFLVPLSILTHLLIWGKWSQQLTEFKENEYDYIQQQKRLHFIKEIMILISQWLLAIIVVFIIWQVVDYYNQYHQWLVSIPVLLAVILGLFGLLEVVLPLLHHYLAYGDSLLAKHDLNAMITLEVDLSIKNSSSFYDLTYQPDQPLQLDIEGLTAKLPNAIVGIKNINFVVRQGLPVMITGVSGAGKSTLLQVLAQQLLPIAGTIKMNLPQQDINHSKNILPTIGYLGQHVDIFDQSLADNLRLAKATATDDELWHVLEMVGLKAWAMAQPQALDTHLGEYGLAISGGQARRIALARLFLQQYQLLLLDEPFAGLDQASREALWQQLQHHQQYGLLVVVSHHIWQFSTPVHLIKLTEPEYIDKY